MFGEDKLTLLLVGTSLVMPVLLVIGLLWFFLTFQKRKFQYETEKKDAKLREQQLQLEKQEALQLERTRIAGEMHDDLGGGLTSIKFLSQKLLRQLEDEKQSQTLEKIVGQSQKLVTNMSEIIWAMNSGFDTLENLIAYSRRYGREQLDIYQIDFKFEIEGNTQGIELSGEKRRGLYLIIKEAIHNSIKHSQATEFFIKFIIDKNLEIVLLDNGIGFSEARLNGNGLKNMKDRMESLNGKFDIQSSENGTEIKLSLPLA